MTSLRSIPEYEILSIIFDIFNPIEICSCNYDYTDNTWLVRIITDGWFNHVVRNSTRKDLITLSIGGIEADRAFRLTEDDQKLWKNLLVKKGVVDA